jgi:hypothetical protein
MGSEDAECKETSPRGAAMVLWLDRTEYPIPGRLFGLVVDDRIGLAADLYCDICVSRYWICPRLSIIIPIDIVVT